MTFSTPPRQASRCCLMPSISLTSSSVMATSTSLRATHAATAAARSVYCTAQRVSKDLGPGRYCRASHATVRSKGSCHFRARTRKRLRMLGTRHQCGVGWATHRFQRAYLPTLVLRCKWRGAGSGLQRQRQLLGRLCPWHASDARWCCHAGR